MQDSIYIFLLISGQNLKTATLQSLLIVVGHRAYPWPHVLPKWHIRVWKSMKVLEYRAQCALCPINVPWLSLSSCYMIAGNLVVRILPFLPSSSIFLTYMTPCQNLLKFLRKQSAQIHPFFGTQIFEWLKYPLLSCTSRNLKSSFKNSAYPGLHTPSTFCFFSLSAFSFCNHATSSTRFQKHPSDAAVAIGVLRHLYTGNYI